MAIPKYHEIMLPLLQYVSNEKEFSIRDIFENMAEFFKLNDSDKSELLPSGRQSIFENRVGWARTYLKKACLLDSPSRGVVQITERGK